MSITRGFAHVSLKVHETEYDKVVKFYMDVFDFKAVLQFGEGSDAAVQLDTGNGVFLEIFANGPLDRGEVGNIHHFALWVDELEDAVQRLEAAGAVITIPPVDHTLPTNPPTNLRLAFFKGLAGELVEIYHEK